MPELNDYHKKVMEEKNSVCGLLDKASDIARGTLESMQALAGTTSCKGVLFSIKIFGGKKLIA